jgi:glycine oxidase
MRYDAVVVGGGLVGASIAFRLAREGRRVALFEAGRLMREASWSAAGILTPLHPTAYPAPLHPLLREGIPAHQRVAAELKSRFDLEYGLWRSGMLVLGDQARALADWYGPSRFRRVDARSEEPRLRVEGDATLFAEVFQLRNDLFGRALLEAAAALGAELYEHARVEEIPPGGVRARGRLVETRTTIVCAGAWVTDLVPQLRVEPVRGQILLYRGRGRRIVVFEEGEYAVPRLEGVILFGSTLERAGRDCRPTETACSGLERRAEALLGLQPSDLLAAWAGLRPATESLLPAIGRVPGREDLIVAAGHYRNGILLAPLTGELVADLVAGRRPPFDLAAFRPPPIRK